MGKLRNGGLQDRGCRINEQHGKEAQNMGKRKTRREAGKYDRKGTFLSKTTGKMKKPLTEGEEAAGGTGLG